MIARSPSPTTPARGSAHEEEKKSNVSRASGPTADARVHETPRRKLIFGEGLPKSGKNEHEASSHADIDTLFSTVDDLNFANTVRESLREVAYEIVDSSDPKEPFVDFKAFRAELIREYVKKVTTELGEHAPTLSRIMDPEKLRTTCFIFAVAFGSEVGAQRLAVLDGLLRDVRAKRSFLSVKDAEAQILGQIRMAQSHAEVLSEDNFGAFAEGQRGVLAGLFGEMLVLSQMKPKTVAPGTFVEVGVHVRVRGEASPPEVDMRFTSGSGHVVLVEAAASIERLRKKLTAGESAQRARYDKIRDAQSVVLAYGVALDADKWFDLFRDGEHSVAKAVASHGRSLLVNGELLAPADIDALLARIGTVQEEVIGVSRRIRQQRVAFSTFREQTIAKVVRMLKSARPPLARRPSGTPNPYAVLADLPDDFRVLESARRTRLALTPAPRPIGTPNPYAVLAELTDDES